MVGSQRGWPDGMGSRGQAERHRQVGEPEGISVSKAGACQCALSGRPLDGASSRVAPQELVSLLSQQEKLGTEAFFFVPIHNRKEKSP